MIPRSLIDAFLAQKELALVGVSRDGKGFGHAIRKELTAKGYRIWLVHHEVDSIGGQACVRELSQLGAKVGGVVVVTPPSVTEQIVRAAASAGIKRMWMQQGAESEEAIRLCGELGISVVHGQCILMFAEPAGFPHRVHRWLRQTFGTMPT